MDVGDHPVTGDRARQQRLDHIAALQSNFTGLETAPLDELDRVIACLEETARDEARYGHLGAVWAASNRAAERSKG